MDYYLLLDMVTELGYLLAMSGAETFRVEESVHRVMDAYGITAEVFAIPNCLIVSIETPEGKLMTRMRRIGAHGNDLDTVDQLSALSRAICSQKPDVMEAKKWLEDVTGKKRSYSRPVQILGYFLGAAGYGIFFGGTWLDALWSGILGIIVGIVNMVLDKIHTNQFFHTITSSFIMAIIAYGIAALGWTDNADSVIIGAIMLLVPGLLFTNAMRDIIYGDTNSGVNRIVQVLLIAMAIALGTAAAWGVTDSIWHHVDVAQDIVYSYPIQCIVCLIGCVGFGILFNVHSLGVPLCALGGCLTWAVYLLTMEFSGNIYLANFWSAAFAAAYSEILARIRKFPVTSYLVVSLFPLLPGAGIYYTMGYALDGNVNLAVHKGLQTAAIAGVMAAGILLVSTATRALNIWLTQRSKA